MRLLTERRLTAHRDRAATAIPAWCAAVPGTSIGDSSAPREPISASIFRSLAAAALITGLSQIGLVHGLPGSRALAQTAAPVSKTQAERDAETSLLRAGYSQIRDLRTTKAGITARAVKGEREVSLLVDSFGKIKELSTDR